MTQEPRGDAATATGLFEVTTVVGGVRITSRKTAKGTTTAVGPPEPGPPWWVSHAADPRTLEAEHAQVTDALRRAAADGNLDLRAAVATAEAASTRGSPLMDPWRPVETGTGPRIDRDRLTALLMGPPRGLRRH
jgi:hypothetical protein